MAISIVYSSLQDAADSFKKAAEQCKKYGDDAKSIVSTLQRLPGEDSYGYVNQALRYARAKAENAADLENRCRKLSEKIINFKDYAKKQDKNASGSISTTITTAVGDRNFFQKIGDWLHDSYVNFLDKIESLGPIGKLIAQGLRKVTNWIGNMTRTVSNWFKYGDGKYFLNIINAVKGVFLALGVFVAAISAAVFTGPWWIVALSVVAIISSVVYVTCQIADSYAQIDENSKALSLSRDGNITAARYYGEIDGVKSYTEHYDFGDQATNDKIAGMAKTFDDVKAGSKIAASLSTAAVSIASLGLTQNANGETVFDFNRLLKGKSAKMLHDSGYNCDAYQYDGFDRKTAFNPMKKLFNTKNTKTISTMLGEDFSGVYKAVAYSMDVSKWISNGEKVVSGINSLVTLDTSGYGTVETVMDIAGFIPIVDATLGDGWKFIDGGKRIIFDIMLSSDIKEPNSYLEFLKTYQPA